MFEFSALENIWLTQFDLNPYSLFQKLRKNFTPDIFWGPAMVRHRVKVVHLKDFNIDPHWQGTVRLAHEMP